MGLRLEFGFFPNPLEFTAGDITITTLPGLVEKVAGDKWKRLGRKRLGIYARMQGKKNIISGLEHERPCLSRIFGLPKTHALIHSTAGLEHAQFLIWVLAFVYGTRLTDTEAGVLGQHTGQGR